MNEPRVSVIMPVYNGAPFLAAAVESVLTQTWSNLELIVVDDGSTDATPAILRKYCDRRVKIVRIAHAGVVTARNVALDHCCGDYVASMDADDVSHPERIERQATYLDQHPDIDVVTCGSDLIDDQDRVIGETSGGIAEDMVLELAAGNSIVNGATMIRRSALPPPPVYPGPPEDYILWIQLARAGRKFHCLDQKLYGFREHLTRLSIVGAESQSRGVVQVQWPLLEECSTTRDLADEHVRRCLLEGWGRVGGAAYRSKQPERGHEAYRRFIDLARTVPGGPLVAPLLIGAESLIWGGCPLTERLALRILELRLQPGNGSSYRKLLLAVPGVEPLRAYLRRAWTAR